MGDNQGNAQGNVMDIPRRTLLRLAAGAAALPAAVRLAGAETWPARPVHLVVGFSAGSASDINARLVGQWLSERLGQPFVIDNRAGAGGNIATEFTVRAPADGYTLLYASTAIAINATLYEGKLSFNVLQDLAPVASVVRTPFVMEVTPGLPVTTVAEFIAYAKARPGQINMATVGAGTAQHLYGEYFKALTGVDMVPVHYRGAAPALTDLVAGRVDVMFDAYVSSNAYINSGKLRALAVTTASRQDELLPGIPTVAETVPGYDAAGWQGLCAPNGTPAEIVERLNREINAVLADPGPRARLAELGGQAAPGTPAEFGRFVASETAKWGKVVRDAGLKAGS
jgi:tripartite-type tricarboxylate transporter receptor subunit TctC